MPYDPKNDTTDTDFDNDNDGTTYKVVRGYFNSDDFPPEVVETGLTLQEARDWCRDPETSSRTCTEPENAARTERCGPWFDGFEEE